jgi:hypothetical protein
MQRLLQKIAQHSSSVRKLLTKPIPYCWSAALFQGTVLIACQAIGTFGSPPGVAVACLAVAAVIMSFRVAEKNFHRPEQIIWIVLAVILVQLEIASINTDRRASSQHEEQARAEERDKFQALIEQDEAINRHQTDAHNQQMNQFQALLSQGNKSIQNLGRVSTSIQEASGYAGGGSSFPTVFAHPITTEDGEQRVGLSFKVRGQYPLFDVHVSVGRAYSVPNPTKEMSVMGTSCNLGEVNVNTTFPLIGISIGNEDAAYFVAEMEARNGTWEEVVDVRRVAGKITARWQIMQLKNPEGPQKILDLADSDFPQAHRSDVLYSPLFLHLPDISQRRKVVPDKVLWPLSSMGTGCTPAT